MRFGMQFGDGLAMPKAEGLIESALSQSIKLSPL